MSQEYIFHAPYGEAEKVEPYLSMYTDNDNLFMGLAYEDPEYGKQPYTDVTVNITKLPYLMAAIDVNNNGQEMMDFLVDNGLAVPLKGQSVRSGYVDFPIVVFSSEALAKIDPEVFAEYQQANGVEPEHDELERNTRIESLELRFDIDPNNGNLTCWVARLSVGEETLSPLSETTDSLPYLHTAIDTTQLDASVTDLLNDGFGCFTGYTIEKDGAEYPIFRFDEGKVKETDSTILDVHRREKEVEKNRKEVSLEKLVDQAKERASEKNQAHEARGDEPTKNPHGMDR